MEAKKVKLAIIRGGKKDHQNSMKNGASVILSFEKYEDFVEVIDVVLDAEDKWFEKGIPSDPHRVFSVADYYIDLTNSSDIDYQDISSKLHVKPIFKDDSYVLTSNRINMRRILNQLNIHTPKYFIVREKTNLEQNLKYIWSKFHTPIIIKEANHFSNKKSLLTYSFFEAMKNITDILNRGGEAIIEEHIEGKYIYVGVIPNHRGEEIYMTSPVETINLEAKNRILQDKVIKEKYLIGHNHEKRGVFHLDANLKKEIRDLMINIYRSLPVNHHILVDMVLIENKRNKNNYSIKILDIHTRPNLFEDSRFHFSLQNSGIDLGRIILDEIKKDEENSVFF